MYTFNLCIVICQLYLSKAGKKERNNNNKEDAVALRLGQASESPAGLVKTQIAGLHVQSESIGLG